MHCQYIFTFVTPKKVGGKKATLPSFHIKYANFVNLIHRKTLLFIIELINQKD